MTKRTSQGLEYEYVDSPLPYETFADFVELAFFDGHTLHLDFCVTRILDPIPPATAPTGKRYPVCRLVLSPNGAADLINNVQRIATLTKAAPQNPPRKAN